MVEFGQIVHSRCLDALSAVGAAVELNRVKCNSSALKFRGLLSAPGVASAPSVLGVVVSVVGSLNTSKPKIRQPTITKDNNRE